ncbi:hypothetical protein G6L98_26475 [Agrobacterium tumefaciens]|uniref:hypothetical protein n=1 Tax=Agrobacterium tumefaciens TaxID=358 RepID=UPI0015745B85|nr:hypothetical protein [Agrobacterium tumefaciens]
MILSSFVPPKATWLPPEFDGGSRRETERDIPQQMKLKQRNQPGDGVTKACKDAGKEMPDLIDNYRPLRLKAVVAATTVKASAPEPTGCENAETGSLPWVFSEMPFSD